LKIALLNINAFINIEFDVKAVFIEAHPFIMSNAQKVALTYGPIVYCLESIDNGINLHSILVRKEKTYDIEYDNLFQMNVIYTRGYRRCPYIKTYHNNYRKKPCKLKYIPYYGFANRGKSDMSVWINKY